jgi:hypothetical protein
VEACRGEEGRKSGGRRRCLVGRWWAEVQILIHLPEAI